MIGIPIWKAALGIHILGWIAQFIGHGVFEGISLALKLRIVNTNIRFTIRFKTIFYRIA